MLTQTGVESGEQTGEKLHILCGPAGKHVAQYPAPLSAGAFQHIPTSGGDRQQGGSAVGRVRFTADQPRGLQCGDLPADCGHVKHECGGQLAQPHNTLVVHPTKHVVGGAFQKAQAAAFIVQMHALRPTHQQRELFLHLLYRTRVIRPGQDA